MRERQTVKLTNMFDSDRIDVQLKLRRLLYDVAVCSILIYNCENLVPGIGDHGMNKRCEQFDIDSYIREQHTTRGSRRHMK